MRALLLLALFSRGLAAVRACRGGGFAAASRVAEQLTGLLRHLGHLVRGLEGSERGE